jgi:hypothetical protein
MVSVTEIIAGAAMSAADERQANKHSRRAPDVHRSRFARLKFTAKDAKERDEKQNEKKFIRE